MNLHVLFLVIFLSMPAHAAPNKISEMMGCAGTTCACCSLSQIAAINAAIKSALEVPSSDDAFLASVNLDAKHKRSASESARSTSAESVVELSIGNNDLEDEQHYFQARAVDTWTFPAAGDAWASFQGSYAGGSSAGSGVLSAGGSTGYFWGIGSNVASGSIHASALSGATSITISFTTTPYSGGASLELRVNGNAVGVISVPSSAGVINASFSFATINASGGGFQIQLIIATTAQEVPPGNGVFNIVEGGSVTLNGPLLGAE